MPSRPFQMLWRHRPLEAPIQTSILLTISIRPGFPLTSVVILNLFVQLTGVVTDSSPVLSPILSVYSKVPHLVHSSFQIFANDLPLFASGAYVVQYADDTQILLSGKKRLPPPAHCYHGAGHWIFGRLVPLPRSEGQHWKNRTHPFRLSSKLSWPRPYLHSASRGHDPWGPHGEEPWRCVRQVPHLGLSHVGSRQKMQRYSHRAVPRASSDPDRPTAYIGQHSGPLARPILSRRLWKRIGEKHAAPPKSTNFALRTVSDRRKSDHISDVRRSWAGRPPVSCTSNTHSTSFTKFAAPESQRPSLLNFRLTPHSAPDPQGRTLIWPSRAWGPRRAGARPPF